MKNVWLLSQLILPRSTQEDERRKEFILNILLLGSVVLSGLACLLAVITMVSIHHTYRGAPLRNPLGVFLLFFVLYLLAYVGFRRIATYALVALYGLSATYALYHWGVDLPTGLLILALTISIAGVLVSVRFALLVTFLTMVVFVGLAYLQLTGMVRVYEYWRAEPLKAGNVIVIAGIFAVTSIVSWLSNREIEKSLRRAWASEKALGEERDLLEVKVEERTEALKKAQLEKMVDLYHQADFGRLATGLLHDLVTPLNVVSLNLEQLETGNLWQAPNKGQVDDLIQRARRGTKSMEHFVENIRRQIQQKETRRSFLPVHIIHQVLWLLSARAQGVGVAIEAELPQKHVSLFGNPIKFQQLVTNLLSNALDACEGVKVIGKRVVRVCLCRKDMTLEMVIEDEGCGIPAEHLSKIFEPFFTTKSKGTGIGLSISKDIIEKEFKGTIQVESEEGGGTTFTLTFPLSERESI